MVYNWDLIEHLLKDMQSTEGETFQSDASAQKLAQQRDSLGVNLGNVQTLPQQATQVQAVLLKGGFIARALDAKAANGHPGPETFTLTLRGSQLLSLIDSSIPGNENPRAVLTEQGSDALLPEVFDRLASKAAIAGGVPN